MARGRKTGGGSRKGIPNKATAEREKVIAASGLMPLDFMIQVLRDESQAFINRQWAAKESAPYLHPRLASSEVKHSGEVRFEAIKRQVCDAGDSDSSNLRPAAGTGKV